MKNFFNILLTFSFFFLLTLTSSLRSSTLPDLIESLTSSVVRIETTNITKQNPHITGDPFFDEFFRRQFGDETRPRTSKGLGSGFIYSADGYVVTNFHVIEKANDISVVLEDDNRYEAEVVGTDPRTDLALLKISGDIALNKVKIGDSDKLRIGEGVIAIGNPLGFGATVTTGIISAKGRYIDGLGTYVDFLQTDAALNRGNSGGPLFNFNGEVVGVNTAIAANGQGIGFAIPISMAINVIKDLQNTGKVQRGWMGVVVQKITPEIADSLGLKSTKGALISRVLNDGPAFKAKLKRGDIILSINKNKVLTYEDLPKEVGKLKPGTKVSLVILRDSKELDFDVELGDIPEPKITQATKSDAAAKKFGIIVNEVLDPSENNKTMILVTNIAKGSSESRIFQKGDVILEINRQVIDNIKSFNLALKKIKSGQNCLFLIQRKNKDSELTLYKSVKSN
ncbi:Do family serine endopeptidase [bacterium]|nr:Do family serine endopeptidase [bacterium]|tara:strand:- start:34588 stop:35946 length:1359 start_codon:yes stop_codon:yes gene_type:complete